ncbi:hypothetical protein EDC04DRAFT_2703228 [Pisolithus marmoratus]|nr:hypothetical protein EDC04DRAFT_2703228 [Pisolithus marmoratus]
MPSRRNRNVRRQSIPEHDHIAYTPTPPLIQLDNSPLSSDLQLESIPHSDLPFVHGEAATAPDDDEFLVKHEGGSVSPVSLLVVPPSSFQPEASPQGHTRSPVLAREPTMLETFSRAVRNYVPSSISIPTAAPSPPRVSKPVSFGSFDILPGFSSVASGERHTQGSPYRRRPSGASGAQHPLGSIGAYSGDFIEPDTLFGSEEDEDTGAPSRPTSPSTAYPTVGEGDPVVWSRWDTLIQQDTPRCILFLGYPCGCQIWDCTDLGSVSEILNLTDSSWGRVSFAGVLASPPMTDDDHLKGLRPLIGVICHVKAESFMVIYSLRSHQIVKRLPFRNVSSFNSGAHFTVISTTNPINLHVLSSASYTILHTIHSSILVHNRLKSTTSAAAQNQQNTSNQLRTVSLSNIEAPSHHRDTDESIKAETRKDEAGENDLVPVYALSHRLLAFASQPPRSDASRGPGHGTTSHPCTHDSRTHDRSSSFPSSSSTLPFGISQISQADLGSTAFKVGGTVLSGMKSIGGMALSAATGYARSRAAPRSDISDTRPSQPLLPPSIAGGVRNTFFSRSAPAGGHESSGQAGSQGGDQGFSQDYTTSHDQNVDKWWTPKRDQPSYIKVLDLSPLLNRTQSAPPDTVAEFVVAKRQGIRHLAFTRDGNSVAVTPIDGQVVRMFQLRPVPKVGGYGSHGVGVNATGTRTHGGTGRGGCSTNPSSLTAGDDAPWHIYNLRRGHTPGVIEGVDVSPDGRWVAVGSGKRTVHIFPINPYGGRPDHRSHVDARIWNVDKPQPLSTELLPVARLRFSRPDPTLGSVAHGSLSFVFLPGDIHLPGSLLPPPPPLVVTSSPSTSSARSDLGHVPSTFRSRNHKDILVFDPPSGILSLKRITIEERPKEPGISSPIMNFATSISFPGTGSANRLGNSPPIQSSREGRKTSGLTQQLLDASMELISKERTVATWQLRRRQDWGEVKQWMAEMSEQKRVEVSDSLAHAELSTFSQHPEIVPRSVYLSHQFLFHTLGEDYHALIRQLHLGTKGDKVVVRREVEPSYVGSGTASNIKGTVRGANEPFVAGIHGGLDHRVASSFDEPLANAIASGLDGPSGVRSIPMFPNGTAGRPRSFGAAALPIKSLKEGVGEGLGRLRREIHRVRSPKEHDGRHLGVDLEGASEGSGISGVTGVSLPTPSTHTDILNVGGNRGGEFGSEGDGRGWDWAEEDKRAVDEAEQFDDVLGFMDEDQTPVVRTAQW